MYLRNVIGIVLLVSCVNCSYQYMGTPSTLRDAYATCHNGNGRLANYGDDLKRVIQNWNSPANMTIWTGELELLSPWISLVGCYRYHSRPDPNRTLMFLVNTSAAACAIHCSRNANKYFALQGKRCLCVASTDVFNKTADDACNLTCDGSPLSEPCGSTRPNNWSMYSRVTFSQDTTATSDHCIAGLCHDNHGVTLYGTICSTPYRGVCSNGGQLDNGSDWSSSLRTCVSTHGLYLVTNMTGVCRTMHHYGWIKFWTGQFRGVAQHIGSEIPDAHIVGCTLITIETNSHNRTSRLGHSDGCETERRPYICELNNSWVDTISTVVTISNDMSTSKEHMPLNSTIEAVSNSLENRTRSPSFSSVLNKDSSISGGAVAAVVLSIVLSAGALASILYLWRRKIWCFQNLSFGQAIVNRTYDASFSNKPNDQGEPTTHDYDEIDHDSGQRDDVEGEDACAATTDDVYAHPTFDYNVTDSDGQNNQKSYLDMSATLPPQHDTPAGIDEEYVYMGDDVSDNGGDNDDDDMYSYMQPRDSIS